MINVKDVRRLLAYEFQKRLLESPVLNNLSEPKIVELIGCTFVANEPTIFGNLNNDYIKMEIDWYNKESLNIYDMCDEPPKIWQSISSPTGAINSNYGWCIFSEHNSNQYQSVLNTLLNDNDSRRAEMIYTRPSMHIDYNRDGMNDFICTDSVSYFIRNNELIAHVKMRSNDAVYGYKNDYAWQLYVLNKLKYDLEFYGNLTINNLKIIWTASSLHVYDRHFYMLKNYLAEQLL